VVEAVGLWHVDGLDAEVTLLLEAEWLGLRSRPDTEERSGEEHWSGR
jgi:hypothetical protein